MCLFISTDCINSLVLLSELEIYRRIINRDSFGMYGLRSNEIYLIQDEDSKTRQVWGGALEPARIPSSWRNTAFPHMAYLRVENMFAIVWSV